MATTVQYNGVTIHNCLTRECDQELVYDYAGVDLIAVRYKLRFEGYIHAQAPLSILHGIQAADAPVTGLGTHLQFDRVSSLLAEPRKPFAMLWGASIVLAVFPGTDDVPVSANTDVDNGPKPRGLAIVNVSPAAIRVVWSVELAISFCPATMPANRTKPYPVINNRWGIAEGRDVDFFTTRRISGQIRFAEGISPKHKYLGFVVPGLENGFRRESIEYEQNPNGLEASYSVVDRQVHTAAPWPATSMDVTHSYATNDGLTWVDECNVTLRGSPEADRRLLLQRMIQIIDQRTDALAITDNDAKNYLIDNVVITEGFGADNVVTAIIAVRMMAPEPRIKLGNLLETKMGKPLELPDVAGQPVPYDRTVSRTPELYGYNPHGGKRTPAFLFLLNCYQQTPCSSVKTIYGNSQQGQSPTPEPPPPAGLPPYTVEVPQGTLQPGNLGKYSQDHVTATYLSARSSSCYSGDSLKVVLPLAVAGSGATARVATLGAGAGNRTILYEAERVGDWPSIPSLPETYTKDGLTGYLLTYSLAPQPPSLSPDGRKKIYRITVKACYGLNKPPRNQKLFAGVLPHTNLPASEATIDSSQYGLASIGP